MKQEFKINDLVHIVSLDNPEVLDGYGHIINLWFDNVMNQYMYEVELEEESKTDITIYPSNRLRMARAILNWKGYWYMFESNSDCLDAMDRLDDKEKPTGWIKSGVISPIMDEYAKDIYEASLETR